MGELSNCQRKTIEAYAAMRSAPRMMEKALNQPMQSSFKVTTVCSQPLTDEEKFLLEYSLKHTAMKAKYINNKDIEILRSIAKKLGLDIDRELELCKE